MGWYFGSQATDYSDRVLDKLSGENAHVPSLWVLEFSNVLRKALHAGKLDPERTKEIIELVNGLPITVDYMKVRVYLRRCCKLQTFVYKYRC